LSQAENQNVWGAELGLRYQLNDWLYFDADANLLYRSRVDQKVDYIPLAPDFTLQLED
jgi:outer membrane receptor protein involved in Fe transport